MPDLENFCKELLATALSEPSDYLDAFVVNDPHLRAAIASCQGVKTDVRIDLSEASLSRLKASLVLSDFTSVFIDGGCDGEFVMQKGEAPHWPTVARIPKEILEKHNVGFINGKPALQPAHYFRKDEAVLQFIHQTSELAKSGRMLVRPRPMLLAYPADIDNPGSRTIRALDVEPNHPDTTWIYRDSQSEQSALPLVENDSHAAAELCKVSVPYIDGVSFSDLAKILDDEGDSLSDFRMAIRDLLRTAKDDPTNSSEVFSDVVRPATDRINRQFTSITSSHAIRIGGATVTSVVLSLVALSGGVAAAASTIAAGGLITLLAKEYADYVRARDALKELPFYLAWRLRRASKP